MEVTSVILESGTQDTALQIVTSVETEVPIPEGEQEISYLKEVLHL